MSAQKVITVPNPNYAVSPLTSVAATVVARRRIQVQSNMPVRYGHNKSTLPSVAVFDIADNEGFIDLSKLILSVDMTCQFIDPVYTAAYNNKAFASELTPSFDQNAQAIIARLRIGSSQGLTIEEMVSYNKLANIMNSYTQSRTSKESHLLNRSDFSKDVMKDRGLNYFLDGTYAMIGHSAPPHGKTQRIHLRFDHSSFFNRVRFLPLFLFRNGIRIEIEFEDVHKVFTYELSTSLNHAQRWPQLRGAPRVLTNAALGGGNQDAFELDWTIGPGRVVADGTTLVEVLDTNNANAFNEGYWTIGPYLTSNAARFYPTNFTSKNTLWLSQTRMQSVITALSRVMDASALGASTRQSQLINYSFLIPVQFYEDNRLAWRGFATLPIGLATAYVWANGNKGTASPYMVLNLGGAAARGKWQVPTGAAVQNEDLSFTEGFFAPLPLFSWDTVESALANAGVAQSIPYKHFQNGAHVQNYFTEIPYLRAELVIDFDNVTFIPNAAVSNLAFTPSPLNRRDPRVLDMDALLRYGRSLIKWDYYLENVQLIMDVVKADSKTFENFQKAYQQPTGIPWMYKRIHHKTTQLQAGSSGQQQIQLPFSLRSMTGLIMVLQDPYVNNYGTGSTKYFYNMLSSFMRRGLTRIDVTIGGTVKPEYRWQLDKDGGVEHIPEAENFFGLSGPSSFDPSFTLDHIAPIRNYFNAGNFDITNGQQQILFNQRTLPSTSQGFPTEHALGLVYYDSSKFIICMSLAKDDVNNFAAGVDTTMSGSVVLNLYFGQDAPPTQSGSTFDWGAELQRPIQVDAWAIGDSVFTAQNDANLVRW